MVVKDKVEFLTIFSPYDILEKTECIEDLESFSEHEMKESGATKMNDFKKICNCAAAVKVKPTIETNRRQNETSRKSRRCKSE